MQSINRAAHRRSRREIAKHLQWGTLEEFARGRIQSWLQDVLEEEVAELLGRGKSQRRAAVDAPTGYRNGHGKTRRLSMMAGTIEVKRPRVRGLEQRFESRLLPLFVRRTEQVAELLPQLYLHGLAQGDFELALRGLLGDGAPLSASSIERLRAKWHLQFETWRSRRLDQLEETKHAPQQAIGGHGQVVAVVAEAGTGKARLVYEFKRLVPKVGNCWRPIRSRTARRRRGCRCS